MCELPTPDNEKINCSRCGNIANPTDSWIYGWPNYGRIELGIHSMGQQFFPDIWSAKPPIIKGSDAQTLKIEWGQGYIVAKSDYRLCHYCQSQLWQTLSSFFFPKVA